MTTGAILATAAYSAAAAAGKWLGAVPESHPSMFVQNESEAYLWRHCPKTVHRFIAFAQRLNDVRGVASALKWQDILASAPFPTYPRALCPSACPCAFPIIATPSSGLCSHASDGESASSVEP